MFKFGCKDAGVECDFVATGNTVEEVKQALKSGRVNENGA